MVDYIVCLMYRYNTYSRCKLHYIKWGGREGGAIEMAGPPLGPEKSETNPDFIVSRQLVGQLKYTHIFTQLHTLHLISRV
jgi:hypothetical protein